MTLEELRNSKSAEIATAVTAITNQARTLSPFFPGFNTDAMWASLRATLARLKLLPL